MYQVRFLKDDGRLHINAKEYIEQIVHQLHSGVHEDIGLPECEILFITNAGKILPGECFQESTGDEDSLYMFVDEGVNEKLKTEQKYVTDNLTEHLLGGLYSTARAGHIGLSADCGLLEEVVGEGLAGHFITEYTGNKPKSYYTQIPERDIAALWDRVRQECVVQDADIEKWYWGDEREGIPPLAALTVGYAAVNKYKQKTKATSIDMIAVSAENIAEMF